MRIGTRVGAFAAAMVSVSSCGDCNFFDRVGNTEKERYQIEPLKPVATGTTATFAAFDAETNENRLREKPVVPEAASATPSAVGRVVGVESNRIEIEALSAGDLTVEFEGRADKDNVTDRFGVRVVDPANWLPLPNCNAYVIAGAPARIPFTFTAEDGTPLMGAGYYPVQIEPAGAATVNIARSSQTFVVLDIAESAPPEITLTSELFAGDAAPGMILQVLNKSDVTGQVLLDAETNEPLDESRLRKNDWRQVRLVPIANGEPICAAHLPVRAKVGTPRRCRLGFGHDREADLDSGDIWIQFLKRGGCELEVAVVEFLTSLLVVLDIIVPELPKSSGSSVFDDD